MMVYNTEYILTEYLCTQFSSIIHHHMGTCITPQKLSICTYILYICTEYLLYVCTVRSAEYSSTYDMEYLSPEYAEYRHTYIRHFLPIGWVFRGFVHGQSVTVSRDCSGNLCTVCMYLPYSVQTMYVCTCKFYTAQSRQR